jgi:hypothetical protein
MTCPILVTWQIAIGVIVGYELSLDGEVVYSGADNSGEVCWTDEGVHRLEVVAIHATGRSEPSVNVGTLDQLRMPSPTVSPTPTATPTPVMLCGDLDQDGVVGFSDFLELARQFGEECER